MYIKVKGYFDCSLCEKSLFENENSKCKKFVSGECKCKPGQVYIKLTTRRVVATILVFIGNQLYVVGEKLQRKHACLSLIDTKADY